MSKAPFALLAAAVVAGLAMSAVGKTDAEIRHETLTTYCEGVAIWKAAGARGVPKTQRLGQPDYKGIAAEQCPGLRPAPPPAPAHSPQ